MTQANDHSERRHRTLGGSSAERWMNCTASVELIRGTPGQIVGERAVKGTMTHELGEKALASLLQKQLTGTGIPGVAEMVKNYPDSEIAGWALRYCELVWERVLGEFVTGKAFGIEEEFLLSENFDMGGPSDFWCVYKDDRAKRVLCIVDLKTGHHEVDIQTAQFPFYACCVREFLIQHGKDIDYCRCIVIQPPLGCEINPLTNIPNDYKEIKYTAKQLDAWKKKFLKAGEVIFVKRKGKFKTGDWCRWCAGQAICDKYRDELSAGSSLDLVQINEQPLPAPDQLSDEVIVKIISHRKQMEAYLKACAKYAISRHLAGAPVAGLKPVAGVSKRQWLDDPDIVVQNLVQLGLNEEELFDEKLKGIGKIEMMLRNQGHTGAQAKNLLDPVTEKRSASISLVPESDPRPAIESAGSMLGDETLNIETDEE